MASQSATSYWIDSSSLPRSNKVDRGGHFDVVVIGGGITGLTAAYLLTKAGRSVAVIERERCAQIETGHTSAHLTMVTDAGLSDLTSRFGEDHACAVWDAGLAAIAQIDTIVREESIACDFAWIAGYQHRGLTSEAKGLTERFRKEVDLANRLGFDAAFVDDVPLVGGSGVRFDNQARIHPRRYLAGVAGAIVTRGGRLYEHSPAEEFSERPLGVVSNGHRLTCDEIVIATHTPLAGNAAVPSAILFQTKLALYNTYVIAGRIAKDVVPDALFWDVEDPYHYLRMEPHRDYDVVIFGGADHKTGQVQDTRACFAALKRTLTGLVPEITITHEWSGQVIETPDGLPYIGETAAHQFTGTGFSGNGLTFGTLTAMMASDCIEGRPNPWTELFDPGRKTLTTAWDYLRENADYPYYLMRSRFAGPQGRTLRAVPRGQGRILEKHSPRVAAFRHEDGSTTVRSAVCPHLGCLVGWNAADQTWDCPCHGSRFDVDGSVISGPAEASLPEVDVD